MRCLKDICRHVDRRHRPRDAASVCGIGHRVHLRRRGDFKLSHHVFVPAEYRGIVCDSPPYDSTGLAGADGVTHRLEASLGFGYRF